MTASTSSVDPFRIDPRSTLSTPRALCIVTGLGLIAKSDGGMAQVGGLLVVLACLGLRRRVRGSVPLALVGYVAWSALSYSWSIWPPGSRTELMRFLPVTVAAVWLALMLTLEEFEKLLTLALGAICALSLIQGVLSPHTAFGSDGSMQGLLQKGNILGTVSGLNFVLCCMAALHRRGGFRTVAIGIVSLVAVLLSHAVAPLIASIGAVLLGSFITWLGRLDSRTRGSAALATVFTSAAASVILLTDLAGFVGFFGKDLTLTGRTEIWWRLIEWCMRDPFLGLGFGAPWHPDSPVRMWAYQQLGGAFISAHNAWLELWLQVGLIGLLLLAVSLITAMIHAFANTGSKWAPWALSVLVFTVIHGIAEPTFMQAIPWLVCCYIFCSTPAADIHLDRSEKRPGAAKQAMES